MSAAQRSKRRQAESQQPSASPLPATKRLKSSHVPAPSGLGFLVDEDARAGKKLDAKLTNGTPRSKSTRVDESHASVAPNTSQNDDNAKKSRPKPDDIIEISSAEPESSELEEDDDEDDGMPLANRRPLTNGHVEEEDGPAAASGADDADMADADEGEQQDEPTFGDLLQARHPEPIDVRKSLQEADLDAGALVPMSESSKALSGHSLGTALSQALKNNDKALLETCFGQTNPQTIRNTIQRQKSQEIAILLEKIAERIHRRPGRTGTLLVWVHHSLIVHGGYLANQPELMKKVKALAQVVRERAASLQPLLHLKGKLDLLQQQLVLRGEMLGVSKAMNDEDMDDPNGVLYIEGEDHESSDSDDAADDGDDTRQPRVQKTKRSQTRSGDEMDLGLTNGLDDNEGSEDEDEDDDDLDGMLDVEAEEGSENDEEDSEEAESEEEEEEEEQDGESEDEDSDTIAVKPVKPNTLNRKR